MAVSTLHMFSTGVLAADIIDELGVTRTQIGFAGSANTAVGALLAPTLGRLTDRMGARWSIAVLSLIGATGLGMLAISIGLWSLLASAMVSGVAQGWANPATNASIATQLSPGDRGTITGLKQSGVQVSTFLAGLTLPIASTTVGWRSAVGAYACVALAIAVVARRIHPHDRPATSATARSDDADTLTRQGTLDGFVYRVAFYSLLLGLAGGSVFRFLPLFAEEVVGFSTELAGLVVAANGLMAIGARIWWGRLTEAGFSTVRGLVLMALGSAACSALLLIAPQASAALWVFAVLAAFTAAAWNVVAMLSVIGSVPIELQGKATGIVMFGFLGGLSIAGPLTGWSVDSTGSYTTAWIATIVASLLGAAVMASASVERNGSPTQSDAAQPTR